MNRWLSSITGIVTTLLCFMSTAYALPIFYVFNGQVVDAQYTSHCVDGECTPDLTVGQAVEFHIAIDFAASLSSPQLQDQTEPFPVDYFLAQYLSGPSFYPSTDTAQFNTNFGFGVDTSDFSMAATKGSIFADAMNGANWGDSPFKIFSLDKIVADWGIGDQIMALENMGYWGSIEYSLQLSAVSDTYPTPEPASILLLVAGILGIGGMRGLKKIAV